MTAQASRARKPARQQLSDLRLAVLDKEGHLGNLIRETVAIWNIRRITTFTSEARALRSIAANPPDMLIINWKDPGCDAIALTRRIRNREEFPHPFLALIIVLSDVTRDRVLQARDAGTDELLALPFSPKALHERICSIVYDRRGFVDVPGFFGPDRRRGAIAESLGVDRRGGSSILIDPKSQKQYLEIQ